MFTLPLCFTISKPAGSFIRPLHKQAWLSWSTRTAIYLPCESGWRFRHWSNLKFFGVVLIMERFTFCDSVKPQWRSRNVGSRNFTQLCACFDSGVITWVLCVYMWGSAECESYLTADKHKKTGLNLWSKLKLDVIWNDNWWQISSLTIQLFGLSSYECQIYVPD